MPPKQPQRQPQSQSQKAAPKVVIQQPTQSIGWLFMSLWLLRVANAITLQTFFQPDEFYQALEPAWTSAFGKSGNAWITWEWTEKLRSSGHPLLFAMCYKLAQAFGHWLKAPPQNRAETLILFPKMLQAAFAAVTDLCTYRFACRMYGTQSWASAATAALTVLSSWNWFASTRTFSNGLECTLTIVAISLWPWEWCLESQTKSETKKAGDDEYSPMEDLMLPVAAAAAACILRPTNVLIWATIFASLFYRGLGWKKAATLVQAILLFGGSVVAAGVAFDNHFYGELVFPQIKFIEFNLVQSLAVFYGKNRPDYYFTEGFPLLLTAALPFAAIGMWQAIRATNKPEAGEKTIAKTVESTLAWTVVTSVLALSAISHKEVRFLFPLLPLLHILAAKPLVAFGEPDAKPLKYTKVAILGVGILLNVGIAIYTSHFHQHGVVEVMHYLRHEYENHYLELPDGESTMNVLFLMPCHSTPWRSHLVYPDIQASALTCEPPIHLSLSERKNYRDEADVFYDMPETWIQNNMANLGFRKDGSAIGDTPGAIAQRRQWPEYLVFFEQLLPVLENKLEGSEYRECWRGFNTHWHDDWRRKGDVVVWCKPREVFDEEGGRLDV